MAVLLYKDWIACPPISPIRFKSSDVGFKRESAAFQCSIPFLEYIDYIDLHFLGKINKPSITVIVSTAFFA